jgi:hypothetical protein
MANRKKGEIAPNIGVPTSRGNQNLDFDTNPCDNQEGGIVDIVFLTGDDFKALYEQAQNTDTQEDYIKWFFNK